MVFSVAVITGGSGGLGQSFAKHLKKDKATVIGVDIKAPEDSRYFDHFEICDVKDFEGLKAIAQRYQPDLWINNAGILANGMFNTVDQNIIQKAIDVNLVGVINGTRVAFEIMNKNGKGHILNVGSLASYSPTPGMAIYSATKHAVRAYTHSVAAELKDSNVKVTLVCPDGIFTPMLKDALSKPDAFMPFTRGKLLDPDDVSAQALKATIAGKLVVSLPRWRAFLARVGGEAPILAIWLEPLMQKIGVKTQRKLKRIVRI